MGWVESRYCCTIDIVQMFWSVKTHDDNAELKNYGWRNAKEDKLLIYKFIRNKYKPNAINAISASGRLGIFNKLAQKSAFNKYYDQQSFTIPGK